MKANIYLTCLHFGSRSFFKYSNYKLVCYMKQHKLQWYAHDRFMTAMSYICPVCSASYSPAQATCAVSTHCMCPYPSPSQHQYTLGIFPSLTHKPSCCQLLPLWLRTVCSECLAVLAISRPFCPQDTGRPTTRASPPARLARDSQPCSTPTQRGVVLSRIQVPLASHHT